MNQTYEAIAIGCGPAGAAAGTFLDPEFSSRVFLALRSGEVAADAAFTGQDYSAAPFKDYGRPLRYATEPVRRLVYTFYDHQFSFRGFPGEHPRLAGDLRDCLMARLSAGFDPLFEAVAEFAGVPVRLEHGLPLVEAC